MNDHFGWLLDPAYDDQTAVLVVGDFKLDLSQPYGNQLAALVYALTVNGTVVHQSQGANDHQALVLGHNLRHEPVHRRHRPLAEYHNDHKATATYVKKTAPKHLCISVFYNKIYHLLSFPGYPPSQNGMVHKLF